MIRNILAASLASAATLTSAIATAKDKVDPAAYPELSQAVLLLVIIARLKHELPDPYSIRDFVVCPANAVRLKDGKPDFWGVGVQFNTKNEAGGYIGIKSYTVVFKRGKVSGPITSSMFASNTGLDGILNRSINKYYERCPSMPDDVVQAALKSR